MFSKLQVKLQVFVSEKIAKYRKKWQHRGRLWKAYLCNPHYTIVISVYKQINRDLERYILFPYDNTLVSSRYFQWKKLKNDFCITQSESLTCSNFPILPLNLSN